MDADVEISVRWPRSRAQKRLSKLRESDACDRRPFPAASSGSYAETWRIHSTHSIRGVKAWECFRDASAPRCTHVSFPNATFIRAFRVHQHSGIADLVAEPSELIRPFRLPYRSLIVLSRRIGFALHSKCGLPPPSTSCRFCLLGMWRKAMIVRG